MCCGPVAIGLGMALGLYRSMPESYGFLPIEVHNADEDLFRY